MAKKDYPSLIAQFNSYAGREVYVHEKQKFFMGHGYTERTLFMRDPVIKEMAKEAKAEGLDVKFWMPDEKNTLKQSSKRLNVHIARDEEKKWRIQSNMSLG